MNKLQKYFFSFVAVLKRTFSTPHIFFLALSSIFGLLFIIITPPLQGPDEQAHFAQVFKYSEGKIVQQEDQTLPISLRETYYTVFYDDDIRFQSTQRYEHSRTKLALSIPLNENIRESDDGLISGTGYSPIGYGLSTVLVWLGRLIDLPAILLIYLARFGGLITWVLLIYLAVKLSPIGKWALALLGILPMALFQASMVTVDSTAFASVILFSAYVFYLLAKKDSNNMGDYGKLALIGVVSVLSKHNMVFTLPIAYLLLLKKSDVKLENKFKHPFILVTVVLAIASVVLILWTLVGGTMSSISNLPEGVNPTQQIKNMVVHPTEFVYALWNTNFHTWGDGTARSLIGTFGWVDTPLALPAVFLGYIVLFIALSANRGNDYRKLKEITMLWPRLFLILLAITFFIVMSAILYVYNSPLNFNIIVGLQGRYFLPIVVLLIALLVNDNQLKLKNTAEAVILKAGPILLLTLSVMYMFIRYYTNTII